MALPIKPNSEMMSKIYEDLGTNREKSNQDLLKLKEWLKKQSHLPQDLDDSLLESFIFGCKGIEDSKIRVDRYFSVRNYIDDLYTNRDPFQLKPDAAEQFLLPGYTRDGNLVLFVKFLGKKEGIHFDHTAFTKKHLLLFDLILNKGMISTGLTMVYDFEGVTPSFLQNFSVSTSNTSLRAFQDNYPIQIKKIIMLNCKSFIVNAYETLVKPWLKKKFTSRVMFLKDNGKEVLSESIPLEILPSDLGGSGLSSQSFNSAFMELLKNERDWCIATEKQKSDENKRQIKIKFDFEQQFGIDGNFRSLNVD